MTEPARTPRRTAEADVRGLVDGVVPQAQRSCHSKGRGQSSQAQSRPRGQARCEERAQAARGHREVPAQAQCSRSQIAEKCREGPGSDAPGTAEGRLAGRFLGGAGSQVHRYCARPDPIFYRGATVLRGHLDERKAAKLGVSPAELGEFTGHGAKLSARIAAAEKSLARVTASNSDAETGKFADAISQRLSDLSTAVQPAELMPAARRKAAHHAISAELDGIEADLLARLGIR